MLTKHELQKIFGPEFSIYEPEDLPTFEIGLTLTSVTRLIKTFKEPTVEQLSHERDRILTNFKRELTKLLWKYLGEVPE